MRARGRDREITLGTSFIVGIFFALVLICAIFFAFGYSLGRRSALPASGVPVPAASPNTDTSAGNETCLRSPRSAGGLHNRIRNFRRATLLGGKENTGRAPGESLPKIQAASRTVAIIPPGGDCRRSFRSPPSRGQGDAAMLMLP